MREHCAAVLSMLINVIVGSGTLITFPTLLLFGYPATGRPSPLPVGWAEIAGTAGCTLENRLFAAKYDEFAAKSITVRGVSTQRPDEQQAFAAAEEILLKRRLAKRGDLIVVVCGTTPARGATNFLRVKHIGDE